MWDLQDFLNPVCLNRRSSRGDTSYFRISACPKIFTKTRHSFQMEVNARLIQQRSLFVSLLDFWDGNAEGNCRNHRIKLEL